MKTHKKCWESVVFDLIFQKNIEKVWDIEKFCNIAKFRKNQHFSMLKFLDGQALYHLVFDLKTIGVKLNKTLY